jgi:hypothetical protein
MDMDMDTSTIPFMGHLKRKEHFLFRIGGRIVEFIEIETT